MEETKEVPLTGKWIAMMNGHPVKLRLDENEVAVACFDTEAQLRAVMTRAGVPPHYTAGTINDERGFLRNIRHSGLKLVYDVQFGLDGRYSCWHVRTEDPHEVS